MEYDNLLGNKMYLEQLDTVNMSEAFDLKDDYYLQQKNQRMLLLKEYKQTLIKHLEYATSLNIAIPLQTIVLLTPAENLYINNLIDYFTTVVKSYDNTEYIKQLMDLHIKKIQDLINQKENDNEI